MRSDTKPGEKTPRRLHELFVESDEFLQTLNVARIPFKWRKRLIARTLDHIEQRMGWSQIRKVYGSIATDFVSNFAKQYVPHGVDMTQDDKDIVATAEKAAAYVSKAICAAQSDQHMRLIIKAICGEYGIAMPDFEKLSDVVARAVDYRWWRRQLRKTIGRAFEAGNIHLGYVHYHADPYASNDAVLSRIAQNRRNTAALEAAMLENEKGEQFSIAELAAKTTANKSIRRGELMLRINGFENVARDNGDQGIFVTWTCPSQYHATQYSGKNNPKYSGKTPREANAYLCKITSLCRSALARLGIGLYGFRIAEPHHDGCPHWHMLLFVRATAKFKKHHIKDIAGRAIRVMKRYAWRTDRGESGAFERRLDAKRIDWNKGSAAGYIAKYVAKNIDGVDNHQTREGYTVQADLVGDVELTPSMRVETWAAKWGIRQFQQWGGAPVTVWRELRRIKKEMVNQAPESMMRAWNAVQKIEGEKRADWAEYLRAQGGAIVPRKELVITLAKDEKTVIGRYGETVRITPYGVRCSALFGVVFKSVRHIWTPVDKPRTGVVFDFPRTRVNNCTQPENLEDPAPREKQSDWSIPDVNELPIFAKRALIDAWATLNASPYPRIFV